MMAASKEIKEFNSDILRITQNVVLHTRKYSKFGGYEGENDIYTHDIAKELYNVGYRKQHKGKWQPVSLDDQYEGCFKCSACKTEQYFAAGYPSYYNGTYCPNCGAKMDGDE